MHDAITRVATLGLEVNANCLPEIIITSEKFMNGNEFKALIEELKGITFQFA